MQGQWIAEDPVHVVVRTEISALFDTRGNKVQDKKRRVFAKFQRGGLPPFALEEAQRRFKFAKKPPEVPIENWPGFYDLEADAIRNGWDEEEQQAIAARLDSAFEVFRVERPKLKAPWPAYDKLTVAGRRTMEKVVEQIVQTIATTGVEPGDVVAYERENEGRPEVIAAVEALLVEEVADEEHVIAA